MTSYSAIPASGRSIRTLVALLLALPVIACAEPDSGGGTCAPASLDSQNVVWTTPSGNSLGSMILGNGDIGLNAWVEPSGDMVFFIGKTDAWDENIRLLKLGKVRVRFTPPLDTGKGFRQELKLRDGVMVVETADADVRLWVDANHPVIQVDARRKDGKPLEAAASFEIWRKTKTDKMGVAQSGGFTSLPAISWPDSVPEPKDGRIGWYHRNEVSPWKASLELQKNGKIAETGQDPLLHRTMGALMQGEGMAPTSATELKTVRPQAQITLQVVPLTRITDTAGAWRDAAEAQAAQAAKSDTRTRFEAHRTWWHAFWQRSWIFIAENTSAGPILPGAGKDWRVGVDSRGGNRFGGTIANPQVSNRVPEADALDALAKSQPDPGQKLLARPFQQACTLSAWIKPVAGERGRILDNATAGTPDGITLDTHPGQSLRFIVGEEVLTVPNCLKPGQWQHVAAVAEAGERGLRLYLDGKLVGEKSRASHAARVTRAYNLQRYVNACGGRGAFPIKFNGSIFTVDSTPDGPDYRRWGGGYWWQNTRLPYWTMPEAGDYDLMKPLFEMYMKALPARKLATRAYYGHDGAFFPETMTFFGNYLDQGGFGYGLPAQRKGRPDGETVNNDVRLYWQGGIELSAMMIRYYRHTGDKAFLKDTLLPFVHEIITFYDRHYKRDGNGKILFNPAYALEDIWYCSNPMPEIVGLRANLQAMIELTDDEARRTQYRRMLKEMPEPPEAVDKDGVRRFAACSPLKWLKRKGNSEKPELYGVFPYLVHGVGRPGLDMALEAWKRASPKEYLKTMEGWSQNPIFMACLGMTEEAKAKQVKRSAMIAPHARFPVFWTPNMDWAPDQDQGSVNMIGLQKMLMQPNLTVQGDEIFLLPAWPKDWNVHFKLHAPKNTTVEAHVKDGRLTDIKVTPESRRKDLRVRQGDAWVPLPE